MDNPFWQFSLAYYAREGVSSCCLRAQDEFGVDVNILLYAAWLAQSNLVLSNEHLQQLDAQVTQWREVVVRPLRQLRQQWRGLDDAAQLRKQVAVLELEAEQRQQNLMWDYYRGAAALAGGRRTLQGNLRRVFERLSPAGVAHWQPLLIELLALLED